MIVTKRMTEYWKNVESTLHPSLPFAVIKIACPNRQFGAHEAHILFCTRLLTRTLSRLEQ